MITKRKIRCESCDSAYTIRYDDEDVLDEPAYCLFCGGDIHDDEGDE